MAEYRDSLDESPGRRVDWKYSGHFLQLGTLQYTHPENGLKNEVGALRLVMRRSMNAREERQRTRRSMVIVSLFLLIA